LFWSDSRRIGKEGQGSKGSEYLVGAAILDTGISEKRTLKVIIGGERQSSQREDKQPGVGKRTQTGSGGGGSPEGGSWQP